MNSEKSQTWPHQRQLLGFSAFLASLAFITNKLKTSPNELPFPGLLKREMFEYHHLSLDAYNAHVYV